MFNSNELTEENIICKTDKGLLSIQSSKICKKKNVLIEKWVRNAQKQHRINTNGKQFLKKI